MPHAVLALLVTIPACGALRLSPRLDRRNALAIGLSGTLASGRLARVSAASPAAIRESIEGLKSQSDDATRPLVRAYFARETDDVYYPSWFAGSWRTTSTLERVWAPAGPALFTPGRNGTEALRRARLEVGQPLQYESRWRKGTEGTYVVDRGFNVASISASSMGRKAVQNCEEKGVDRLELVLKPDAAGKLLYRAELDVIARHTDATEPDRFDCVETVRQTVVIVPGESYTGPPRPPMVKEVETFCTYDRLPSGAIVGTQRTATFLARDAAYTSGAPLAEQQALVLARGPDGLQTALDVRLYSLLYEPV